MTDPLDYWQGNTEVVETLTHFLSLTDVARCCQLSSRWREALNQDHLWWRLAGRLEGCRAMFDRVSSLREEAGPAPALAPLCGWARTVSFWRGVRGRWRRGGELLLSPSMASTQPDTVTCYDCDGELLVVATEKANIFCYSLVGPSLEQGEKARAVARAVKRQRVDKVRREERIELSKQFVLH